MKSITVFTLLFCCLTISSNIAHSQIPPAPTDQQMAEIDKLAQPLRHKINEVLAADKTGQHQTYLSDLTAIAKEKDLNRKASLLAAFDRKHYDFIKKAFTKAKVDLSTLKQQIAKVLGHNKFAMDEFGSISSDLTLPAATFPKGFSITMESPFEATEESGGVNGFSSCKASVFGNQATLVSIAEVAGGCRTKGSVGDTFEVPSGSFNKLTVSAHIGKAGYEGFVFALAGYCQINGKIGLRLQGPGLDKIVVTHNAWALAPVIWYRKLEMELFNYQPVVDFTGTFSSGNIYTAQVYAESFALAIPAFTLGELKVFAADLKTVTVGGQ